MIKSISVVVFLTGRFSHVWWKLIITKKSYWLNNISKKLTLKYILFVFFFWQEKEEISNIKLYKKKFIKLTSQTDFLWFCYFLINKVT